MMFLKYPWVVLFLAVLGSGPARAEVLTLQYESAPSAEGPWRPVDPARLQMHPGGVATLEASEAHAFFRVRISGSNEVGSLPLIRLQDLPPSVVETARRHVRDTLERSVDNEISRADVNDAEEWADANFAPFACPLYTPGNRQAGPRLAELKLVRPSSKARTREGFLRALSADDGEETDGGYVIVSLDRTDLPVLQFATEGPTPGERLLRRTRGQAPARIVRYGPTFWAAENAAGDLLANLGTEPFKIPHEFVGQMNTRWTGELDTERGLEQAPPANRLRLAAYASYRELKDDIEASPVHQLLRRRRAEHARHLWDIEAGQLPPVFEVAVGQTTAFLPGIPIDEIAVQWEENDMPLATVVPQRGGGFLATGLQEGSAPITYWTAEGVGRAALRVNRPGRPALATPPGVAISVHTWIAGAGWNDQMRYYQLESSDWCPLVGCGPTALAMLFGYWDRKGVPSAFYTGPGDITSLRTSDAPQHISSASAKSTLRKVYNPLHDYCDVICFPTTDAGATWPGDLIEGYYGYTLIPRLPGWLGTSTTWAWDSWGDDWHTSGSRVATGLTKGRPGVVGLGVLWHYGVAYAYRRKDLSVNGTLILRERYFKVNEGWKSFSPSWYSAYDVFLGLSASMWQKQLPQEP